ncbi:MAG: PHP domain-containing protein, partial [Saprospiraceae bacterium]
MSNYPTFATSMYLNCHSYYSLRHGTLSPTELVTTAAALGHTAMVQTDINNTSASFEFLQACDKAGIKGLLGIEYRDADHRYLYTGIAKNQEGWKELCSLLTHSSLKGEPLPAIAPPLLNSFIIYRSLVKPLADYAPHEYYGVTPAEIGGLFSSALRQRADRLIAFPSVVHRNPEGFKVHKLMRCIDLNIVHSRLGPSDIVAESECLL